MSKRIVVLGAGFAGLEFCKKISRTGCDITLVDRQNHHLFQPLLYQVATAGLAAPDIAQPIRGILSGRKNITVIMDHVTRIDPGSRKVHCERHTLDYDYLVLATGARTSYFANPEWEKHALGLKSLAEAVMIRDKALYSFERAESEADPEKLRELMTFVVVGGGPTGVEMAGALAELTRHVINKDFKHINPASARIVLIEAGSRLLSHMDPKLSANAESKLRKMGVEVMLSSKVQEIAANQVKVAGNTIRAYTIVWSAGVSASPLTACFDTPRDRAGRLEVQPDLSVPDHENVFAVGDLVSIKNPDGSPVPGVSPAAIQMGQHVAKVINAELKAGESAKPTRPAFKYWDKGSMATIGRAAAVADVAGIKLTGLIAWLAWLFVHLVFLVGFRNKVSVFWSWIYSYLTYKRAARIIWDNRPEP